MIRGVDAAKGHMKRLYTRCVNREASLKFDEKWGGRKNNATKQSIPHERTNKQTNTRTHAHTSANSHLHAHKKKHNTPAANIAPLNVWNKTTAIVSIGLCMHPHQWTNKQTSAPTRIHVLTHTKPTHFKYLLQILLHWMYEIKQLRLPIGIGLCMHPHESSVIHITAESVVSQVHGLPAPLQWK